MKKTKLKERFWARNSTMTTETKNTDIYEREEDSEENKRELVDKIKRTIKEPPVAPYAKKNSSIPISD